MNINTIVTAIEEDCHQSVWALATELKISRESIRQILTGEFGIKQVWSAWIMHFVPVGVGNNTLMRLTLSQEISEEQSLFLAHLRALDPQNTFISPLFMWALYPYTAQMLNNSVSSLILLRMMISLGFLERKAKVYS